jgi:hypothetical protein
VEPPSVLTLSVVPVVVASPVLESPVLKSPVTTPVRVSVVVVPITGTLQVAEPSVRLVEEIELSSTGLVFTNLTA